MPISPTVRKYSMAALGNRPLQSSVRLRSLPSCCELLRIDGLIFASIMNSIFNKFQTLECPVNPLFIIRATPVHWASWCHKVLQFICLERREVPISSVPQLYSWFYGKRFSKNLEAWSSGLPAPAGIGARMRLPHQKYGLSTAFRFRISSLVLANAWDCFDRS